METIQRGHKYAEKKYFGTYRAIVIDNNDPQRIGRLILQVPEIFGTSLVTDWAFPKTGYLSAWDRTGEPNGTADGRDAYRMTPRFWADRYDGGDKGDFLIPDVNDGVWCCFEAGDACRPLWEGRYWTVPHGVPEPPRLSRSRGDETQTSSCESSVQLHFPDPWHKDDPSKKEVRTVCAFPKATDSFVTGRLCGINDPLFPDPFYQNYGTFPDKPLMKNYGEVIPEPPISYSATYPNNRVLKTKRGIVIEVDDTYDDANNMSHCRIHVWHPSKTWWEYHPDGTKTEHVATRRYVWIDANDEKHIKGNWHVMVHGDVTMHVNGNMFTNIHGSRYTKIDGEDYLEVGGNRQEYIHTNDTLRVNRNKCTKVDENRTTRIDLNDTESIGLSQSEFVKLNYSKYVECGTHTTQVVTGDVGLRLDNGNYERKVVTGNDQVVVCAGMQATMAAAGIIHLSDSMIIDLAPFINHMAGGGVPPDVPTPADCTLPEPKPCICP